MSRGSISVSVVSHGQNALVNALLADLAQHCAGPVEVILTENILDPTPLQLAPGPHHYARTANDRPRGFAANHNSAFRRSSGDFFFVVNPDIRLQEDPFQSLQARLDSKGVAAVAPLVRNPSGEVEDSARRFPTVASLLRKLVHRSAGPDYAVDEGPLDVEWVAGMFIGFRRDAFARLGGFDERYFLYYEDVDICRRLRSQGYKVVYDTTVSVIHEARRASRRNPRLMKIHATSALRYLLSSYEDRS